MQHNISKETLVASKINTNTNRIYDPQELKTLFEAIQLAPSWLSKRFIMKDLCGWDEARLEENVKLRNEEEQQSKMGNKQGGFR